ncbi:hypothetical protein DH2020_039817 [Rehmannia glutinosa]|uniref:Mitochondrial fission protein ELM1 n=1 Tax=Rehmannia glutinosa TaxID=99300 RepID=A0ABR0UUR2_REHGL
MSSTCDGESQLEDRFHRTCLVILRRAIIIGNGFAGAENQCIGLVRALGFSNKYTLYRVNRPRGGINEKLHWLPVSVHKQLQGAVQWISGKRFRAKKLVPLPAEGKDVFEADARHIAKVAQDTFDRDGPILVVASGRDTIAVASSIKKLVPENVFLVQIQHPRSRLHKFDLVVLTVGALHQADSAALRNATTAWYDEMALLPKPLLVVSIGGPTRRYGADLAMQLTTSLKSVLSTCGSLRISFSRRTPKIVTDILMTELSNHPKVYIWNGEDPNPHMGHLAWADAFVITADSVSMLSEACSTGVEGQLDHSPISENWHYSPLCDTEKAAGEVIKALAERGWRLLPQ